MKMIEVKKSLHKLALEEALLVLAVRILSIKIESPGAGYMVERWDPSA